MQNSALETILKEITGRNQVDITGPERRVREIKNQPATYALGLLLGAPSVAPDQAFAKFKASFESFSKGLTEYQLKQVTEGFIAKHAKAQTEFENNFVNKAYLFLQYAGTLVSAALTTLAAASIGKIILGSALLFTASAPAVLITVAVSLIAAFVTYKGFQHLYNKRREEMVNKLYEDVLEHAKSLSTTSKASSAVGASHHAATTETAPSTGPATVFKNRVGAYNGTHENAALLGEHDRISLHDLDLNG